VFGVLDSTPEAHKTIIIVQWNRRPNMFLWLMSNMIWIVIGVPVVIVVILAVLKLKISDSEKESIGELKKFSSWMYLGCVVFIITFAGSILHSLNTDANDKYEYKDGKLIFIEAKCLMGSIFHKKTLILSDDNIEIFSRPFLQEKKTVRPYNTLKEATFSRAFIIGYKGAESRYKVVIEYSGGFFNKSDKFYFNQTATFDFLKTIFKDCCKNRCVITEELESGGN
jgi:hypothetical protein